MTREGRISHGCLGLYTDANEYALKRVLDAARVVALPGTKFGIQIGHAGRKASTHVNWHGSGPLGPKDSPWRTVAPSPLPYADNWHIPAELDDEEIERIIAAFAESAKRAARIGFDIVEVHAAHGYLVHEFLSPASNKRGDAYGGSLANRMRFPLEIVEAVRNVWPAAKPLFVRVSAVDEGGWTLDDTVAFARELKKIGADVVDQPSFTTVTT